MSDSVAIGAEKNVSKHQIRAVDKTLLSSVKMHILCVFFVICDSRLVLIAAKFFSK